MKYNSVYIQDLREGSGRSLGEVILQEEVPARVDHEGDPIRAHTILETRIGHRIRLYHKEG